MKAGGINSTDLLLDSDGDDTDALLQELVQERVLSSRAGNSTRKEPAIRIISDVLEPLRRYRRFLSMHCRLLTFEMELNELLLGRSLVPKPILGDCKEFLRTIGLLEKPIIDDGGLLLI